MALKVVNLSVSYFNEEINKEKRALRNISFSLEDGQILALLGPSGGGKTSLLRALAGLEECEITSLEYKGTDLAALPAHERGIGMVFQNGQLFPNYNVYGNIAYGLSGTDLSETEKKERVAYLLELVDLVGFEHRGVDTLSGGQASRVALARALATSPRILLLDEPLSALDRSLREDLTIQLREILKKTSTTAIYVTHDQDEAFGIGDLVGFVADGALKRVDTPDEFYRHPRTLELAKFLGYGPFLNNIAASYMGVFIHANQYVAARPFAFEISRGDCARCGSLFSTVVELRNMKGNLQALVRLDAGVDAWIEVPENYPIDVGDLLALEVNKGKCTIVS